MSVKIAGLMTMKIDKYGYNGIGQGKHSWAFSEILVRPAYPVFILFLNYA